MKYLSVNIYHNGDVDNELVNLSLGEGDVVLWRNPHQYPFTVSFPSNPFQNGPTFIVPGRSDLPSGPLKTSVQAGDEYDYLVQNTEMALASDPGIIIKP